MKKEDLQVLVDNLREKAKEEEEQNRQLVINRLQQYTDCKIRTSISISYDNDMTMETEFWNEAEGKWDFGSTFRLYYYNKNARERRNREAIEISTGTIGSYSKKEIYQIARIKMLSKLWDDVDNLAEFLDGLKYPICQVFHEKQNELRDMEYEEKREARVKAQNEIKDLLKPEQELMYGGRKIKITKVTPKRIYYVDWCEHYNYNEKTNSYNSEWRYSRLEQFKKIEDMVNTIYYDFYEQKGKCYFIPKEEA